MFAMTAGPQIFCSVARYLWCYTMVTYFLCLFLSSFLTHRGEESITQVDCRQIVFSTAHKHHLLIVYPREVVVMDMEIRQAIGSLTLERNSSPLLRLLPCRQRNVIFCLHENGGVSMRFHQTTPLPSSLPTPSLEPHVQVHHSLRKKSLLPPSTI